jgi:hypothetical protein
MSNYIPPKREDFVSDEKYQEFLEAYEAAVYLSEEMEMERYYERKEKKDN